MKYQTAASFRQALEHRLRERHKRTGDSLVRLRKLVVFDRVLARLVVAASGRWILKGAVALDFLLADRSRTTKDIDIVHHKNEDAATTDLLAAQAIDLGDFFVISVQKIAGLIGEGAAVRYRLRAELAGRLFEEAFIDVAFSDPLGWQPEPVRGPSLLTFAGIEPIEVPALPLEQQIAEKVHAYTWS